jgi:hypothetical protein
MFEVQIGILLTDKVEVQGSKCVKMQTLTIIVAMDRQATDGPRLKRISHSAWKGTCTTIGIAVVVY